MSILYCYSCKIKKELSEFQKKPNGYYPKNCILCSKGEVIVYPMTEDEEKQILDFIKIHKTIVYKSIYEWAMNYHLYRSTFRDFKKELILILKKNKIRKREIIFKGFCPISRKDLIKSQAFKI